MAFPKRPTEIIIVFGCERIPDNFLALDCEMVGVGEEGRESRLARISIVDNKGSTLLDEFVKPDEKVIDYRT